MGLRGDSWHYLLAFTACLVCIWVLCLPGCGISTCLRPSRHRALTKWSVEWCLFETFWCFCFSVLLCWGPFLHGFGVILVSFWWHFGVILVSLLSFGDPGLPRLLTTATGWQNLVRWTLFCRPKGFLRDPIFVFFWDFSVFFSSHCFETLFGRLLGSLWPPPTMKMMVLPTWNHLFSHFHLYVQNDLKFVPKGTLLGPFGLQNAEKWRSEKRLKKEVEKYP